MNHSIICFEGPSAIGKSALCESLSNANHIVPEVNLLFNTEKKTSKFWYYEKQIQRYQFAKKAERTSILDGDPFQPLWYNWVYGYPPMFCTKEETYNFYRNQLSQEAISFPDQYIVFETTKETLQTRKSKDKNRQRRNFEKHLKFIEPQKRYFHFLKEYTDIKVEFVTYETIEKAKLIVQTLIENRSPNTIINLKQFEEIVTWLNETDPGQ